MTAKRALEVQKRTRGLIVKAFLFALLRVPFFLAPPENGRLYPSKLSQRPVHPITAKEHSFDRPPWHKRGIHASRIKWGIKLKNGRGAERVLSSHARTRER